MPLTVRYVSSLEEVVAPTIEFLSRDRDLFAKPRIVVSTAGAKAWLGGELAKVLGASGGGPGGTGTGDGIVANVGIAYPGAILSLLEPPRGAAPDAWSFDRLTFAVLDVITGPAADALGIPFDVAREPLLAARRIAALFDGYHVRRPGMIKRWEAGQSVLAPVATGGRNVGGEWAADALAAGDAWQFRTWREVRRTIGEASPPARLSVGQGPGHEPLLVAGLQSLSLRQVTCLRKLAAACDVSVLLVHPAPPLRARWARTVPPVSLDVPPPREPAELPEDLDPLVATWLHGARETQALLASQGIHPEHAAAATAADAPTLLARLQRSVTTGDRPVVQPHDIAIDGSFSIHRCHTLARQAEVLHDAILHAFHDLDGLQPHEVAIVSPCLERLAPHLEAVFAREITGAGGRVTLPLVLADRGLHEVSDAARLLLDLMGLVGSRCSVEGFRAVATHPLVQAHFGIDDDTIRTWDRLIERARIHWGFDAAHRERERFPAAATEPHTWRAGLERMLLGAVLPAGHGMSHAETAEPAAAGATLPLDDVPLAALPAIATLVRIFEIVRDLDATGCGPAPARAASDWCAAIEAALFALCGTAADELAEPLRAIRGLREAASATPVPFHDVRALLEESLTSVVGRQPLRTGAITATSMIPLRDVPFRVICVAGYDDGAVGASESQGDDLVSRQALAGDGDPRIDARRALLDCVRAARDRLVVTCNGIDVKTNKSLPLVTPLAELVDFAMRHGVRPPAAGRPSGVEIEHPRHAVGRRNFAAGGVQPGLTWSHDASALAAAEGVGGEDRARVTRVGSPPELPVIELALLEDMVRDPLRLYLRKTLGIDTWRDDEEFPAATFPLALSQRDRRELAEELLDHRVNRGGDAEAWERAARASGRIPFGAFGDEAVREIRMLVDGFVRLAADAKNPVPLTGFTSVPVRIRIPGGLLAGTLANHHARAPERLVDVRVTRGERNAWGLPLHVAALRLLVARAAGLAPECAVVAARHKDWKAPDFKGPAAIARTVRLAEGLCDARAATERLTDICGLLPRALAAPCGRFNGILASVVAKLATDPAAARREFSAQLSFGHEGSAEELVYGRAPRFDDVCGPGSPEVAFHEDFERLFAIETAGRAYVLS